MAEPFPAIARTAAGGLFGAALALAGAAPAGAHPHVFAEARLEVAVDAATGAVSELRHVWRFDELFSTGVVLLEFDANANLRLEPEELAAAGAQIRESLADYGYFTAITADGADIPVLPPDVIHADFEDGQLLLFFAVRPAKPVSLSGTVSIGVHDPTMYTAIDFTDDAHLVVEGDTGGCARRVVRPSPDEIIARNQASLTEAFFNDPGGNDLSKFFATRLELECG